MQASISSGSCDMVTTFNSYLFIARIQFSTTINSLFLCRFSCIHDATDSDTHIEALDNGLKLGNYYVQGAGEMPTPPNVSGNLFPSTKCHSLIGQSTLA